jgi:RNA polymerase sigma factor (sigma-70 family)
MTATAPEIGHDFDRCSCDMCRRAAIAWHQLELLRRICYRRTGSWVDAEDAAHEAIVRALEAPDIDLEQLPAWLTRVALNLCTDLDRDQARMHKRIRYQVMQQAGERDVESAVVDRAYSLSAYTLAMALPPAQRTAVMMRADGRSVGDVAEALEVSPKAAESLLSRARATLRRGLVAVVAFPLFVRRSARTSAPLVATAATLSTLFVLAPSIGGHIATPAVTHHSVRPMKSVYATKVAAHSPAAQRVVTQRISHRSAPRITSDSASGRVVVPARDVHVGPAHVHQGGAGWTHPEQSLAQSVQQCVDKGVVVTSNYVGCAGGDERLGITLR